MYSNTEVFCVLDTIGSLDVSRSIANYKLESNFLLCLNYVAEIECGKIFFEFDM